MRRLRELACLLLATSPFFACIDHVAVQVSSTSTETPLNMCLNSFELSN